MSGPPPPYPAGASNTQLFEWARNIVEFIFNREQIEREQLPQPLRLAHKIADEKAAEDGLMMYDPVAGEVVYSKGGQWLKVSDNTPV